mmetsp:Transcript_16216/g.33290  ORF Transcript_16216/g.33290 Transcript_16216/m.33290 type:complete len:250 (-) Transcript_16216:452-1201(-)
MVRGKRDGVAKVVFKLRGCKVGLRTEEPGSAQAETAVVVSSRVRRAVLVWVAGLGICDGVAAELHPGYYLGGHVVRGSGGTEVGGRGEKVYERVEEIQGGALYPPVRTSPPRGSWLGSRRLYNLLECLPLQKLLLDNVPNLNSHPLFDAFVVPENEAEEGKALGVTTHYLNRRLTELLGFRQGAGVEGGAGEEVRAEELIQGGGDTEVVLEVPFNGRRRGGGGREGGYLGSYEGDVVVCGILLPLMAIS